MKKVVSIKEAMTAKVLTIGPNATVATAAKKMAENSVGSIVVVEGKKPIGILTERDLLMKVVSTDAKPSKVLVKKVMSSPLTTIGPDSDVVEAARIMARNRIRRLPVVDKGKLIGIVTTADIMAVSPEIMEASAVEETPREEIEESVCEQCGEVTTALYEFNGMWVCENCRDTMGG
ncbi:MAG: cyclic nucleotide-binding/CBS domain-containing protein [Candidatus Hadarchaeales archaeon]